MHVLSEEYQPFYKIIPQSIVNKQKNLRQNVSVHNGCRGIDVSILYQKKPQQMLGLRPLPPCYPYCGLRGGDILLFVFLVFVVCYLHICAIIQILVFNPLCTVWVVDSRPAV
nr:MAG TPA: hypothetical protein [Caudoviricetes sp.]